MEILKQILTQIKIIKTITTIEYNNNDTSKKNNRSDNNQKIVTMLSDNSVSSQ